MTMSKWEYTLNSFGWTLVGIILTLTYQRTISWFRQRRGLEGELPPVSSAAYFGTLLVLISIVSTLFSLSSKFASDELKQCQVRVNQANVAVINQLKNALVGKNGLIPNIDQLKDRELLALENKRSLAQLRKDFQIYFAEQNHIFADLQQHQVLPLTACNDSKPPPNLIIVTPSPSPGGHS